MSMVLEWIFEGDLIIRKEIDFLEIGKISFSRIYQIIGSSQVSMIVNVHDELSI